ncbi:hypothetical protein E4K10_05575 [Streptomyces sp. T1317-0309]|nr:hypothetical protein E4K10_05575 [Streptomyces sp. T1317-0309]
MAPRLGSAAGGRRPATVSALPLGSHVSGRVIGRQPFGVFLLIDGVPNAVGLAEIAAMPHHMELPAVGAAVTGEVISPFRSESDLYDL